MSPVPAAAAAKSLQSCPTLCDPIDGSPPGCPVPGILQARTLEWVAISFSSSSCTAGGFCTHWALGEIPVKAQKCLNMDWWQSLLRVSCGLLCYISWSLYSAASTGIIGLGLGLGLGGREMGSLGPCFSAKAGIHFDWLGLMPPPLLHILSINLIGMNSPQFAYLFFHW